MLQELTVQNFAIVDRLQVEWSPGLNVITGETGAGKSILVDAVGALLGDRLGPEVVRSGASRALVEGVFGLAGQAGQPGLDPRQRHELQSVLETYGLEPEDGALIVTREIAGSGGRGGARVNGRSVPLSVLQDLGELLVDVHGQSQHMALLRPREQLEYLDRYAGALPARSHVADLVRQLRATREALRALQAEEREALRLHDMLRHEMAEIERAELQEGEEEELLSRRSRLQHVERLREAATLAHAALQGQETADGEQAGAVELLGEAVQACQDGARFDAPLGAHAENLNAALALAEDAARSLRDYLDSIEADPEALERTAARLFLIGDLKRKYGETVIDVLAYAADARRRLDEIEHRGERLAELEQRQRRLLGELGAAAASLSAVRVEAAERLATEAERELADLRLGSAHFTVVLVQTEDPAGVPVGSRCLAFDTSGIDRVEFLLAANPGDEPRPMARVASGGELARIALALKTILAQAETRPTLIFDEIDVGVGGRTAPVVGEKLWRIAAAGRQVLCVTHMPQVAAYGDAHYVVAKASADDRAATRVSALGAEARVDELASMLAGAPTGAARESARELLARAGSLKASVRPERRRAKAAR